MNKLKTVCVLIIALFAFQTVSAQDVTPETARIQARLVQINDLVTSIKAKRSARDTLRENMLTSAADEIPEMQESLTQLNAEVREARAALEQIAIGSVDLQDFTLNEAPLDWRVEVGQVMLPLMENLKRITEKPRKIEELRSKISRLKNQRQNSQLAADNVFQSLIQSEKDETLEYLKQLHQTWIDRRDGYNRDINLAQVQLDNLLQGDGSIWKQLSTGLMEFFKGRGLTLLLAAAVGLMVHLLLNGIAVLFARRQKGEDAHAHRTREKIIRYSLKVLKTLVIVIAVLAVFYIRGDVLLMALALLVLAGLALSLRHTIPQYLNELRLLLNLGSIREDERVIYQGIPWKVTQLNVYSVLKNPEITGVLRLPIEEMMTLTSRPSGNEPWFPASREDLILLEDSSLVKVVKLTPEHVLLESLAGTQRMIPTADFYNSVFENLSRSETYFVSSVFGVGYSHQKDSIAVIPEAIRRAVEAEILATDVAEHLVSVSAELKEAGASSLDIWVGVKMNTAAASSYFSLQRLIQRVCVATCTKENWDIPFPQLTLHNA